MDKGIIPLNLNGGLSDHPVKFNGGAYICFVKGNADITIKFDSIDNRSTPFERGWWLRERFDEIFVSADDTDEVIYLYVSDNPNADFGVIKELMSPMSSSDAYDRVAVDNSADAAGAETPVKLFDTVTTLYSGVLRNTGSCKVYIGFDDSLTVDNGMPLNPGDPLGFDNKPQSFYAVCDGGNTGEVGYMRIM